MYNKFVLTKHFDWAIRNIFAILSFKLYVSQTIDYQLPIEKKIKICLLYIFEYTQTNNSLTLKHKSLQIYLKRALV
jgi:hypothetical protein